MIEELCRSMMTTRPGPRESREWLMMLRLARAFRGSEREIDCVDLWLDRGVDGQGCLSLRLQLSEQIFIN